MMIENFPRDIQISIFKHFDMDTRIKCGFISKLKVPEHILKKLNRAIGFKLYLHYSDVFYRERDRVIPRPFDNLDQYKGWYIPHEPWLTCSSHLGHVEPQNFMEKWYDVELAILKRFEPEIFQKWSCLKVLDKI